MTTILWWICIGLLGSYLLLQLLAVGVGLLSLVFGERWSVDPKDPTSRKGTYGIFRRVEPLEFLVIGRQGEPAYMVNRNTSHRLTVKGAQGYGGQDMESLEHWNILTLGENDHVPNPIISDWGILSPLYVLRRIVYSLTALHVVRVWFPFIFHSASWNFELYGPLTTVFTRGRPKGIALRENQRLLDAKEVYNNCAVWMVQDVTDHVLWQFPLRILTETFPTTSGLSFRADVTLTLELANLLRLVSVKDWSSQVFSTVSDAVAKYFRARSLDQAYASSGEGVTIQGIITDRVNEKKFENGTQSLLTFLGLVLRDVTLNDLVPADKDTEDKVNEIMSILPRGARNAEVGGLTLKHQVDALKESDPVLAQALAAITAAQKSKGGRVDMLIGTGSIPTMDQGLLNRVVKNTDTEGGDE